MGMFDELTVDPKLGEDHADRVYQTKSLTCDMYSYHLSENGELRHTNDGVLHKPGDLANYSGELFFYDIIDRHDPDSGWIECLAFIRSGRLVDKIEVKKTRGLSTST